MTHVIDIINRVRTWWCSVGVGTKSVLFGAHCFFLHPWFVALAWWKLYGFPFDPRLWVAFFVHDLGYIGKQNMDGPEGETHPKLGARIMALFDPPYLLRLAGKRGWGTAHWHDFCLLHSRYYAKRLGLPFSRLCVADKLAFALTPRWLYLPMVNWTGEIHEYLSMAKNADTKVGHFVAADYSKRQKDWHIELCRYMREWVETHKNGAVDTWTSADRNARTASVVGQPYPKPRSKDELRVAKIVAFSEHLIAEVLAATEGKPEIERWLAISAACPYDGMPSRGQLWDGVARRLLGGGK